MAGGGDPLARGIPPGGVGPGSQPEEADGAALEYLAMPGVMGTYRPPVLPEPEDAAGCAAGLDTLRSLRLLLAHYRVGGLPQVIDLRRLPAADRRLVLDSLREGEVSIRCRAADASTPGLDPAADMEAQETRLAGVWRVRGGGAGHRHRDVLEVCAVPGFVHDHAFAAASREISLPEPLPAGVMNAPGVLAELLEQVRERTGEAADDAADGEPPAMPGAPGDADAPAAHVLNLTLLPQSEQDLACLGEQLGRGPVSMLSRGYGNCRVTATGLRDVWWVQYFNSDDKLILNTLEVTPVPAAVLAAQEDIEDSAERLGEILAALTETHP
jgi:hydrogenase-1 operon protein HyaF